MTDLILIISLYLTYLKIKIVLLPRKAKNKNLPFNKDSISETNTILLSRQNIDKQISHRGCN